MKDTANMTYADRYPNASETVRAVRKSLDYGADPHEILMEVVMEGGWEWAREVLDEAQELPDFHT